MGSANYTKRPQPFPARLPIDTWPDRPESIRRRAVAGATFMNASPTAERLLSLQSVVGNRVVCHLLTGATAPPQKSICPDKLATAPVGLLKIQRRILKGGSRQNLKSFKDAEFQAEIEDSARDLQQVISQEVRYYSEIPSLLRTEEEHIVDHGNLETIGGEAPEAVAGSLAQKMEKRTKEPYRIKFHSCEAGAGFAPPAERIQTLLHESHSVNAEVSGPRGLLHRVGGDELISKEMPSVTGTKLVQVPVTAVGDPDWYSIEREKWSTIRAGYVGECVFDFAASAKTNIGSMAESDLDAFIWQCASNRDWMAFVKGLTGPGAPKKEKAKREQLAAAIAKASEDMNSEKFIESMMTITSALATPKFDEILYRHGERAWREKASLISLGKDEPELEKIIVKGDPWRTFKTAVAPLPDLPYSGVIGGGLSSEAALERLRMISQGPNEGEDAW
jgi:hypothetical protein